ncbi:MAG: 4Fe-4S dicluster domain-containing protein, partial [Planctomycetales bacterium]|nr:4Fe-4S dicluster domain-containing protein [Planctomycetales bacterium]
MIPKTDTGQCQGCDVPETLDADARSRRWFLQKAVTVTYGAMSLTLLPSCSSDPNGAASAGKSDGNGESGTEPVWGFLIDTDKCMGNGKCLLACRTENNVPEGNSRTWVERFVHFKDGTVQVDLVPETGFSGSELPVIDRDKVERAYFVPKLCNHCVDAPCTQVCPVNASFKSPEGFELIDPEQCIGCSYCVQACPYGVRFINHDTGTADKCTWCYQRVMRDEQPACVEGCPTGARIFGRLDDTDIEISKQIAK